MPFWDSFTSFWDIRKKVYICTSILTERKMKTRILVILFLIILPFVACKKDDDTKPQNTTNNETPVVVPKDNLVAEMTSETYTPTEMSNVITNGHIFTWYLDEEAAINAFKVAFQVIKNNRLFILDTTFAHRKVLIGYKRNWTVESHVFTYRSVSAKGEPIVLSGRVSFPNSTDGTPHQVQSLSLCTHFLLHEHAQAPGLELSPFVMRTLYNSAVIEPDYEGYGLTSSRPYPGFSYELMGRQTLDCARAALQVMKKHGVTPVEDVYSTVWGYSLGTPNAMAVMKYYDVNLPQDEKEQLNITSGFMGCGPLLLRDMVEYLDENPDFNAGGLAYMPSFLSALSASEFKGYKVTDFLPSWVQTHIVTVDGKQMTFMEAMQQNKLTWFDRPEEYPSSVLKNNLAEDMCTADGHLDKNNPKTQILLDLIERLSSWDGWIPQEDVYLTHCQDDNFIPFAQVEKFYQSKKSSPKMHFKNVSAKPLDNLMGVHAASTATDILISILHDQPADSYKYLY